MLYTFVLLILSPHPGHMERIDVSIKRYVKPGLTWAQCQREKAEAVQRREGAGNVKVSCLPEWK